MPKLPTLFVSHGAPSVVIEDHAAHHFLKGLQSFVPKPTAILINSAHFEAAGPAVVRDAEPGMIYDFRGFAPELYDLVYPAPGHPALADQVMALLSGAGFAPQSVAKRGYDHGAWNPLMLAIPDADIPVVQVSTDPHADAAWHMRMGAALAPLRNEGVLIIGSGHITHNLPAIIGAMRGRPLDPTLADKVAAFTGWMQDRFGEGNADALRTWTTQAPFVRENHPTDEHLLPIFTAFGAAGEGARGERIHASAQMGGAFAWDAYRFS